MMCTFSCEVSLTRILCTSSIQSPDATTQPNLGLRVSRGIVEATTTDATATAEATTTSVSLIRL